jgi:1A family penicillin-binding protein
MKFNWNFIPLRQLTKGRQPFSSSISTPINIIVFLLSWFLFLGGLTFSVQAQEKIATYPPLPAPYTSIKVFDNQGRFAGRILLEKKYWVAIDRIPIFLQKALVAIEDSRFYEHSGIDIRGIARALVKDVVKGKMAEGGSTITQQLIKNKYLSGEKTIERKVKEGLLAMEYERKYTKKQILEMYFNEVYFGNGAWGVAQAAHLYFDKNPEELNENECSLLAGVPKAPNRYNPLGDPVKIRDRRNLVLKRMADLSMISSGQEQSLKNKPISVIKPGEAFYYLSHIRNKLVERYGQDIIERGGLEVTTAMDLPLQRLAERILRDSVKAISPQLQGALLCLDPTSGDVLAAVGGVDFSTSSYNRAFIAKRQPGSSIKPLIYAAALEKGFTASSLFNDTPAGYNRGNGEVWKPLNYERKLYGDLTLRQALAHSNNIITVKLLESIGVPYFLNFAANLGLNFRSPNDLSLALGTEEVTLGEMVSAYSSLANNGVRSDPRVIIRIYDKTRNTWLENPPVLKPALSPATAFVTTQMLRDVLTYGTAKSLNSFSQERPSAGKTGTTDDYRDAWFIGYTPQLITGVWAGYDKPRPGGRGFTGGAICAPIWGRFMRSALAEKPIIAFSRPDNVVSVVINPKTGCLAGPGDSGGREEFYLAGTQPIEYCNKVGEDFKPLPLPPAMNNNATPRANP